MGALIFSIAALAISSRSLAADSPTETEPLPEVAVGVVDTSGSGYLITRPLVLYEWLTSMARGSPTKVHHARSGTVVFEEEITAQLHAFRFEELRSVRPSLSEDGATRIVVTLADGQSYRCLPGFTQTAQIPSLLSQPGGGRPNQVTRKIRAFRHKGKQEVEVNIPWASLVTMEVFPLYGKTSVMLGQIDELLQERARLSRRMQVIEDDLAQKMSSTDGP